MSRVEVPMPATSHVSLADYLRSDYEPECELISGELLAKPMGTLEHMNMERRPERLLEPFEEKGLGHVAHELSCRKGDDVRIPDVVFYRTGAHFEDGS